MDVGNLRADRYEYLKEIDIGDFVVEKGSHFLVLVFEDEDYVIKIPKLPEYKKIQRLDFIAYWQTYLSQNIKGVLPCYRVRNYLVMPKAPGVRMDKLPTMTLRNQVHSTARELAKRIKKFGFLLTDLSDENIFYDKKEKQVWLIDFSTGKKVPKT